MDVQEDHTTGIVVISLDNCVASIPNHAGHQPEEETVLGITDQETTVDTAKVFLQSPINYVEHSQTVQATTPSVTVQQPQISLNNSQGIVEVDPDVVYFTEVIQYLNDQGLPSGASENYKRMIKKRAQHYSVINGELYYGHKHPKKVVIGREHQKEILDAMHVAEGSGVHRGVKKMHTAIHELYYWRGMYVDVANYVRRCSKCIEEDLDTTRPGISLMQETRNASRKHLPTDRATKVWKKVEVKIYGPYGKTLYQNEYLLTIIDPFSHWIEAQAIPEHNHATYTANFIFETFCRLGFAQCSVVGFTPEVFEMMQTKYKEKFDQMQDIFRVLGHPFEDAHSQQCFVFTLQESSQQCSWASEILDQYAHQNSNNWDQDLDRFLFQFRSTSFEEYGFSPFYIMFGRNPTGFVSEEDKENINIIEEEKALEVPTKRRRLQSSILQCRHCHETFTSKISFRIHQRKHTEEAKRRGTLEGEEPLRPVVLEKEKKCLKRFPKKKRRPFGRGTDRLLTLAQSDWSDANSREIVPQDNHRAELTATTVAAVKALLLATKEERAKRGKYQKYTPELRDEIAKFAIDHGNLEAMRYFTDHLGSQVSESTVRNFVKLYRSFTPEMKDEIGRFAYQYGLDSASKHYSAKLGRDVRKGLVRKFKKYFLRKFPEARKQEEKNQRKGIARQKKTYSPQLKEEMGRYACQFGIPNTIQHYSEKLQFAVKESTVRKFKKLYLDKQAAAQASQMSQLAAPIQEACPASSQTIDILHTSLSVLNNPTTTTTVNMPQMNSAVVYNHPYSTIPVHPQMTHNGSITFHQPATVLNQCAVPTSMPYQQPTTVIMNQSPAAFTQAASMPTFQHAYTTFNQPQQMQQTSSLALPQTTMAPIPLAMNQQLQQQHHHHHHQHQVGVVATAPCIPTMAVATHAMSQPVVSQNQHQVVVAPPLPLPPQHPLPPTQIQTTFTQPISTNLTFDTAGPSLNSDTTSVLRESEQPSLLKETDPISGVTLNTPRPIQTQTHEEVSSAAVPAVQVTAMEEKQQTLDHVKLVLQMKVDESEQGNGEAEDDSEEESGSKTSNKKNSKKKLVGQKRGNYATYSPELRAEIGKYAAEHGNQKAMQYFKQKLGCEIPESTIRGLKDKYLIKRVRGEKEVTTLGFAQRGRPMRLGKYDEIVQDCIRELVKSGERVSSFLAIATAKQVLMQYEPTLLEEYGGPIKLNPTWAKSFLKRIGLHNTC